MKCNYKLQQPLSSMAKEFVTDALNRSFNDAAIEISDLEIAIGLVDEIDEQKVTNALDNIIYVTRSINRKTLYENAPQGRYQSNPMNRLLESADVIRTADGMFSFQGEFWEVLKACKDYVYKIAIRYDAVEQEYPVLWPIDLYKKINYFNDFPHQIILGAPLQDNYETRDVFATKYEKSKSYSAVSMNDGFGHSHYGLQCAVCDTCYYNIRHTRNHKNTIYTTYNKVFRNESSATGSLDRLTTFSVRDIMFVGDRDFVFHLRQKMLDEAAALLAAFDFESKLETANDPFFTNDSMVKGAFQNSSELKHELLVKLNYSDSYMAVGSVNMHLDFFGTAFDILLPDESPVYSGCLGIGFERLAFALYCQYGPDLKAWPSDLKACLNL